MKCVTMERERERSFYDVSFDDGYNSALAYCSMVIKDF